jgi:hypothetical protein
VYVRLDPLPSYQKWEKAPRFISVRYAPPQKSLFIASTIGSRSTFLTTNLQPPLARPAPQKKQTSSNSAPLTTPTPKPAQQPQAAAAAASAAAKKAKLKGRLGKRGKLAARSGSSSSTAAGGGHRVLGGADYVDIMMGSRRREREEAQKLPPRET